MQNIQINLKEIIKDTLQNSLTYAEYMLLMQKLVTEKTTSGDIKTEDRINFTMLNERRMKRLNKTLAVEQQIEEAVADYKRNIIWLVLAESWCGDAAQALPVINKIASLNSNIELKIVLRDENLPLMQEFLTNDAQAIPKLVALDKATYKVLEEWGPRPDKATKMVVEYKAKHGVLTPQFKEELQMWYTKDKGLGIMQDLLKILVNLSLVPEKYK